MVCRLNKKACEKRSRYRKWCVDYPIKRMRKGVEGWYLGVERVTQLFRNGLK